MGWLNLIITVCDLCVGKATLVGLPFDEVIGWSGKRDRIEVLSLFGIA